MTIIKNSAKSQIIESTNKLLENINSKIKPLLNDDDFLWIITPEREKNKFSASIVSYSIQNTRDNSELRRCRKWRYEKPYSQKRRLSA